MTEFNQLLFNVNRYHESLVDVARTPRASDFEIELKDIAPYRGEIERLISSYEKTTLRTSSTGRDEAKDLAELKTALNEFFGQGDAAINTIKESFENKSLTSGQALAMRELGALAITVSLSPAFEKVTQRHAEQIKTMSEVAKDLSDEAKTMASNATLILVVGGVAAVLLGLALGYWVAHKLSLGIGQVASVAQQAASGNYQARAKITSKDELGQMATSFNAMLDRITALVTSEGERDEMQKRLMNFLVLVSDVGKGDLTKRGEVTADMFGNLADGFNLMIARFGQLLKQVREAAERVNKSAGTLRDSAGQMAGTAKHQADESVKTLSAVEQLAAQMRQVAETAGASSESAKQVLQATERGRVAVQETVQDMQSIRVSGAAHVEAGQGPRRPVVGNFANRVDDSRYREPDQPARAQRRHRGGRRRRGRSAIRGRRRPGAKTGRKLDASDKGNRRSRESHSKRNPGRGGRHGAGNPGGGSRIGFRAAYR